MPNFEIDLGATSTEPRFIQRVIFPRRFQLVARVPIVDEGGIVDSSPPTVENIDPAVGSILTKSQAIQFDVVDNVGSFSRILVAIKFATGVQELVHDGETFVGHYVTQSSRVQIANGFRYTLLRSAGWHSPPTPRIFPIDSSGNDGS